MGSTVVEIKKIDFGYYTFLGKIYIDWLIKLSKFPIYALRILDFYNLYTVSINFCIQLKEIFNLCMTVLNL